MQYTYTPFVFRPRWNDNSTLIRDGYISHAHRRKGMFGLSQVVLQLTGSSLVSSLLTSLGPLLPQIGSGMAVGYVGGWLAKKVAKIIMYLIAGIIGLFALVMAAAEQEGWVTITIHWDAIYASGQSFINWVANSLGSSSVNSFASSILANLTAFTGPALVTAYLGFRKG